MNWGVTGHRIKKETMPAAKYITALIIIVLSNSCKSLVTEVQRNYEIEVFKSQNKLGTYLALTSYDSENRNKPLPGAYFINNVAHHSPNEKTHTINVKPGIFKIDAGLVGKDWITINTKLQKGDSISLKFYHKQANENFINRY